MKLPIDINNMPKSYLIDSTKPITILLGNIFIGGTYHELHYNVAVKGMFYGEYNSHMKPVPTDRDYEIVIEVDYICFYIIGSTSTEYRYLLESLNYYYNSVEYFNHKGVLCDY